MLLRSQRLKAISTSAVLMIGAWINRMHVVSQQQDFLAQLDALSLKNGMDPAETRAGVLELTGPIGTLPIDLIILGCGLFALYHLIQYVRLPDTPERVAWQERYKAAQQQLGVRRRTFRGLGSFGTIGKLLLFGAAVLGVAYLIFLQGGDPLPFTQSFGFLILALTAIIAGVVYSNHRATLAIMAETKQPAPEPSPTQPPN
jgi:hypothetical protein